MSPITYTPHNCKTPEGVQRKGTLWQCDICDATWSAYSPNIGGGWRKIDEPRKDQYLAEARQRLSAHPTTPTVTPDMVQLTVDTYKNHTGTVNRGYITYCAACGERLTGNIEFRLHALSVAYAALQDALDKAGRDE